MPNNNLTTTSNTSKHPGITVKAVMDIAPELELAEEQSKIITEDSDLKNSPKNKK